MEMAIGSERGAEQKFRIKNDVKIKCNRRRVETNFRSSETRFLNFLVYCSVVLIELNELRNSHRRLVDDQLCAKQEFVACFLFVLFYCSEKLN